MNIASSPIACKVWGVKQASMSMLPCSAPQKIVILPSCLLPLPLLTATGLPHPKSIAVHIEARWAASDQAISHHLTLFHYLWILRPILVKIHDFFMGLCGYHLIHLQSSPTWIIRSKFRIPTSFVCSTLLSFSKEKTPASFLTLRGRLV